MKSLAVRLTLAIAFIAIGGAAAYFVWTSESQARRGVDDARAFDQTAIDLDRSVSISVPRRRRMLRPDRERISGSRKPPSRWQP